MKERKTSNSARVVRLMTVAALALGLIWPLVSAAQNQPAGSTAIDENLAQQVRELQGKVAALEAALRERYPTMGRMSGMGASSGGMQGMGMGMMGRQGTETGQPMGSMQSGQGMSGMRMMQGMGAGMMDDMDMGMMGGMSGAGGMAGMSGMGMMRGMGGGMGTMDTDMTEMMGQNPAGNGMGRMGGMGRMRGMGGMSLPSALPGFPGASHLYHIGATDFFLDHPQHITLTTEQQTTLNQIKERALLAKADSQRKIDQAEQELWELTSADQPDATKIEAKVREIEKLRGDQRLAFIRVVGEAAQVLTPEQVQSLSGQAPPAGQPATHQADPSHQHQPGMMEY